MKLTKKNMTQLKTVIVGCFYTKDFSPETDTERLIGITNKWVVLRKNDSTHKISLRRFCRNYSVVKYLPEFQDYNFDRPFDINHAFAAIELATYVYGYTKTQALTKFLEAGKCARRLPRQAEALAKSASGSTNP